MSVFSFTQTTPGVTLNSLSNTSANITDSEGGQYNSSSNFVLGTGTDIVGRPTGPRVEISSSGSTTDQSEARQEGIVSWGNGTSQTNVSSLVALEGTNTIASDWDSGQGHTGSFVSDTSDIFETTYDDTTLESEYFYNLVDTAESYNIEPDEAGEDSPGGDDDGDGDDGSGDGNSGGEGTLGWRLARGSSDFELEQTSASSGASESRMQNTTTQISNVDQEYLTVRQNSTTTSSSKEL